MCWKLIKFGAIGATGLVLVGGLLFGSDAVSYVASSARSVRSAVKESVPIEFELKRARDMLDEIIPELHANVRLIASEEVEVANLKADIQQCGESLTQERTKVARLRDMLDVQKVSYTIGGYDYSRTQVKEELSRQFDRLKEAEVVLEGKKRLLDTREKGLRAAMDVLDRTRNQKAHLQDQIEALASQHRLVQAASVGSTVAIDHSKLAQTERMISEIKKRLDVAERVLAHEARFVQPMQIDAIDEPDLIAQVDEYLKPQAAGAAEGEGSVAMNGAIGD